MTSSKARYIIILDDMLANGLGMQTNCPDFLSHSAIAPEIDSPQKLLAILEFCNEPKSRVQIQEFCGIKSKTYFKTKILSPLLSGGQLVATIPDKPSSPNQKYVRRTAIEPK